MLAMRDIRIHCPEKLSPDTSIELGAAQTRHISQVLRLRAGAGVTLFDGRGGEYPAIIEATQRNRTRVRTATHDPVEREAPLAVTLWHGVCRGERMDQVIQKATELGVTRIQPLLTERTVVKLAASRLPRKLEHWQRVAISACEQSGRNRIPEVLAPLSLADCLPTVGSYGTRLLLHPAAAATLGSVRIDSAAPLLLCTGPEGGFSDAEVATAVASGLHAVSLGPRVMRTETAPLAALAALQTLAGDLA